MRVAVLFSGGKDSCYATHLCLSWGWEAQWLTIHPPADSMMFHHPNTGWTALQAEAAGIKWHEMRSKASDASDTQSELDELEGALRRMKVDGIVSGAVGSEYQKQRIEVIGQRLGLPTFAPLWHKKPEVLREMLVQMEVYLVSVAAQGLDEKWLGKRLVPDDVGRLEALRPTVSPFLEGGEGETFVTDAPYFGKRIVIDKMEKSWDGLRGTAWIKKAHLEEK